MYLLFGQLADDLVELARGDGEASRLRDLARVRAADPDLEIGRGELERSVLLSRHLEQRIGQDRHRVALLDDRLDASEASLELALLDRELHRWCSPDREPSSFSSL